MRLNIKLIMSWDYSQRAKKFGVVKSGPLTLNFVIKNLKSGNRSIHGDFRYMEFTSTPNPTLLAIH